MDIGEKIFAKLWKIRYPGISNNSKNAGEVLLIDIQERLTFVARALTCAPIFIYPAQEEGGWHENSFYLPVSVNRYQNFETNLDFYFFRIIFLSLAYLGSRRGKQPVLNRIESRKFCYELSEFILPKIREDFPPFGVKLDCLLEAEREISVDPSQWYWLWGQWMKAPAHAKDSHTSSNHTDDHQPPEDLQITTEIEGVIRDEVNVIELNKKAQEDYTLNHTFEKCLTAEDFNGNWRDFDGDDELDDHENALEEVSMTHVIRVHDPAHSVVRSKLRLNALLPEEVGNEKGGGIPVREWDYRKKTFRENHCKVFVVGSDSRIPGSAQQTLASEHYLYQELLKKYRFLLNERDIVRRVPYGEDLDLDAMVDAYSEVKAGNHLPENLFRSKRKIRLNLAINFLVDLSLSTDAYVDNEKILDLEKRTLTVFGQVLDDLCLKFSIHGFHSETRNHCTLQTIKNFDQSWGETRDIVASIRSNGYTRMGPALRVLTTNLRNNIDAKDKLIIFITDGKPTDYDLYEGTYGINDVRMAIKEARLSGIRCCGLAMDSDARFYFPVMMGEEPFEVLKHPKELTPCLTRLFSQVFSRF